MSSIPKKAFPNNGGGHGMALRDYFAAKAMQELIAAYSRNSGSSPFLEMTRVEISYLSFRYADTMLTAGGHNANDEQGKS